MDDQRGWTDSPLVYNRWRVMRAMARGARAGEEYAQGSDVAESLGLDGKQVADAFNRLSSEGLAKTFPVTQSPGYTTEAILKPEGVAMVEQWEAATGTRLRRACSGAVLWWLDSLPEGSRVSTDQFLEDVRGSYFGDPFPRQVVFAVGQELRDAGLIKAHGAMGESLLLAELTPAGRLVLSRYDGDVEAWHIRGDSATTINVTGSSGVNVANHSTNVHQASSVRTEVGTQVSGFAAALEQMVPLLDLQPVDVARAYEYVQQLQDIAPAAEAEPERARALISATRDFVVGASSSAAAPALVALAHHLISLI